MVNHGAVRSTVKPKELVIDEFSAWINSNTIEVSENVGEDNEFIGYQYDCTQYEKDEYIKIISEDNANLMLAITEIYELMNGGVM